MLDNTLILIIGAFLVSAIFVVAEVLAKRYDWE